MNTSIRRGHLLRVALHPRPEGACTLRIRSLDDPRRARWAAIGPEAGGTWATRQPAGRYLVAFSADGLRREARPVQLFGDRQLDLFPVRVGARRVRIGDRRVPATLPETAVDAFLVESADLGAMVDVLAVAGRMGLFLDAARSVDDGTRLVTDKLMPAPDRALDDPSDEDPGRYLRRLTVARERADQAVHLRPTRDRSVVLPLRAAAGDRAGAAVEALRQHPAVLAAGAALRSGPEPAVRRPAIDLRLVPALGAGRLFDDKALARLQRPNAAPEARRIARLLRGAVMRPRGPDRLRVELPPEADEAIEDLLDLLLESGRVLYATPVIAERCALLTQWGDFMALAQWDSKRMGVEDAHDQLANTGRQPGEGVRLAVIDDGVEPIAGQVVHPDLVDRVALYDERGQPGGHIAGAQGHGGSVAALAAGTDHPGRGPGIAGVAPRAAVVAYKYNGALGQLDDLLEIAGGLRAAGGGPADVVCCAMRFGASWSLPAFPVAPAVLPAVLDGPTPDALTRLAHHGRRGRGCLVVLAAGNEGLALSQMNPIATSSDVLTCGASDLVTRDGAPADGLAALSNFGPELGCLAPGYREGENGTVTVSPAISTDWPAEALETLTARQLVASDGDRTELLVDLPSHLSPERVPVGARVVLGAADRAETLWKVKALTPLANGSPRARLVLGFSRGLREKPAIRDGDPVAIADLRWARLGPRYGAWHTLLDVDPTASPAPWVTLVRADGALRAEVLIQTGTLYPSTRVARFDADAPPSWLGGSAVDVWRSASGLQKGFGQTSAASALCAGVGALVLAANPALTGFEAREILRRTAVPLDGPTNRQGAGRLDAAAAVAAALVYEHPRDLWLKTHGAQPGERAPDSEDVWLTHSPLDPEHPDALPRVHEALDPARTAFVCARVRNRGADAHSLDARVRFVLAAAPADGPFLWPRDWTAGLTSSPTALPPGSYLLGEVALPAGIPPGGGRTVQIPWPAWATPHAGSSWDRHVLVEVTPHDGAQTGDGATIADNANLARRRVKLTGANP